MGSKVGLASKFFTGFTIALLFSHVCMMQTRAFPKASRSLQFSTPQHFRKSNAAISQPTTSAITLLTTTRATQPPTTTAEIPTGTAENPTTTLSIPQPTTAQTSTTVETPQTTTTTTAATPRATIAAKTPPTNTAATPLPTTTLPKNTTAQPTTTASTPQPTTAPTTAADTAQPTTLSTTTSATTASITAGETAKTTTTIPKTRAARPAMTTAAKTPQPRTSLLTTTSATIATTTAAESAQPTKTLLTTSAATTTTTTAAESATLATTATTTATESTQPSTSLPATTAATTATTAAEESATAAITATTTVTKSTQQTTSLPATTAATTGTTTAAESAQPTQLLPTTTAASTTTTSAETAQPTTSLPAITSTPTATTTAADSAQPTTSLLPTTSVTTTTTAAESAQPTTSFPSTTSSTTTKTTSGETAQPTTSLLTTTSATTTATSAESAQQTTSLPPTTSTTTATTTTIKSTRPTTSLTATTSAKTTTTTTTTATSAETAQPTTSLPPTTSTTTATTTSAETAKPTTSLPPTTSTTTATTTATETAQPTTSLLTTASATATTTSAETAQPTTSPPAITAITTTSAETAQPTTSLLTTSSATATSAETAQPTTSPPAITATTTTATTSDETAQPTTTLTAATSATTTATTSAGTAQPTTSLLTTISATISTTSAETAQPTTTLLTTASATTTSAETAQPTTSPPAITVTTTTGTTSAETAQPTTSLLTTISATTTTTSAETAEPTTSLPTTTAATTTTTTTTISAETAQPTTTLPGTKSTTTTTTTTATESAQPTTTLPETTSATTTASPAKDIKMEMRINKKFDTSLYRGTNTYNFYVQHIESAIEKSYKNIPSYIKGSVRVTGFRSGSIIADYTIYAVGNNIDFTLANRQVSEALEKDGIPVAPNGFAESEKIFLTTKENFYPLQRMELRCNRSDYVEGTITWRVNDKAVHDGKYKITNDVSGSTLKVEEVSERDSGRYSCIIEKSTMPYIQWQQVVIKQRPEIIVDKSEIKIQCSDQTVSLRCCAKNYPIEWDWIPPGDVTISESHCITLRHNILSTNCGGNTIFTCQLKDMGEIGSFNYRSTRITVQTVRGFDCKMETLGVGKIGDNVTGACEKGLEGHITYQCQQMNQKNEWIPTKRQCVVEAIKDLEKIAEVLPVEQIREFVSNLSNVVEENNATVTQSADTVQTIVEILSKLADISQTITINEDEMNDFLKIVEIIVSDESKNAWKQLNNGSPTGNKSTELLQAIENISDHLTDQSFEINKGTIQLNRTTIENSFIGDSLLPNSTTQIVISNVEPTPITIIVFTKLDNVLPTRNTSNNDNRTSANHINGDVVVVKVKKTINNISISFHVSDASLKNPQCVFWNFDLDRWDSSGCKVKLAGNEANKVTCECNHTTSFSVLMSPVSITDPILDHITYIGVAISMASLVVCIIIEMFVWKSVTKNSTSYMRHVSIVNIAVSLLIANICFIVGAANPGESSPVNHCSAAVFFMHFFYLALFFWMLVSALLLLNCTVKVLSQMSRTKMMVISFTVGYGAPLLIAVITVASTAGAGRYIWTRDACWLNWYESKALLAFVIPALTIVAFMFVLSYKLRGAGATIRSDEKHVAAVIIRCVSILTPVFCLTWGFGIGTMVSPDFGIHVVFAVLLSLQGFLVLVFGTLLDSKVRESLPGMLLLKTLIPNPTMRTNSQTSTGSLQNMRNSSETRRFSRSSNSSIELISFMNA